MKLKTCSFCKEDKLLWKANPKACQPCWAKYKASESSSSPKPINLPQKDKSVLKRIKSVSDKKLVELAEYRVVRDQYLKDHPICEFYTCDCREVELHHAKGRIGSLLTDIRYFRSLCREHHQWAEKNPVLAKEMGLSLSRLDKEDDSL